MRHETCGWAEKKKGSEWLNEEVGGATTKKRTFEEWLQRRDIVINDKEWLWNGQLKFQKELRTGNGESDWGMISRVKKYVLERGKSSEKRLAGK